MPSETLDSWMRGSRSNNTRKRKSEDDAEDKRPAKKTKGEHLEPRPQKRGAMTSQLAEEERPEYALQLHEETGDIFQAPPNTLIIHACNCQGSWSAGIAAAFKKNYPQAFQEYATHCNTTKQKANLIGTALLIPPSEKPKRGKSDTEVTKHFVGCLFTSVRFGKGKDSPSKILEATGPAMEDLLRQVKVWNSQADDGERVGEVRICQINSGLFNVPWAKTKAVLESIDVAESDVKEIMVVVREE
jgi:ADP-ribose 1''-phosphate phosphatase